MGNDRLRLWNVDRGLYVDQLLHGYEIWGTIG